MLNADDKRIFVFENYRLDVARKMLYRDGEEILLPPKAVETLAVLIRTPGEIVSKEDLISAIWNDKIVEESNLAQHLHVLRKTLGVRADGKPYIETLRRRGYRFNSDDGIVGERLVTNDIADSDPGESPKPKSGRRFVTPIFATAMLTAIALILFVYSGNRQRRSQVGELSVIGLTDSGSQYAATISRDGKAFVYFELNDGKYRLVRQLTGQSARTELAVSPEKVMGAATFSPDGRFVYFAEFDADPRRATLYRVPAEGGDAPTRILDDVASSVSFSPDGSEFVFARVLDAERGSALVVASVDGGRQRTIFTSGPKSVLANGGAWSPDGKSIAYAELDTGATILTGRYSIRAVDVQTGAVRLLSRENWDNCYKMDWTRDGTELLFLGTREGEGLSLYRDQVYLLSVASGESRRLTNDGSRFDSDSLTVTNEDDAIAVPVKRLSQIYNVDLGRTLESPLRLTNGPSDGRGGIAALPDGRLGYISRIGEKLGIWVVNADGSDRRQIFSQLANLEELRATPDGKYFIFAAPRDGRSHLYRIDANGENLTQITDGDSSESDSSVSPDGRFIYSVGREFDGGGWKNRLFKSPVEGGRKMTVCDTDGVAPHVSPDGKLVSLIENDKTIVLSIDGCDVRETFDPPRLSALNNGAVWTRDGKALVFSVFENDVSNLWLQPIDGGEPRRLTSFSGGLIYGFDFSRDGESVFLARGEQIRNAVLLRNFR